MNHNDSDDSDKLLREAARAKWAPVLAFTSFAVHAVCLLIVGGWLYFLVPWYKKRMDDLSGELTSSTIFVIQLSDMFVNYWHFIAIPIVANLVFTCMAMYWITRQFGRRCAALIAAAIAILILSFALIGFVIIQGMLATVENELAAMKDQLLTPPRLSVSRTS